jgi:uncharacterized protein involved in oxidation of intracellular sulfur
MKLGIVIYASDAETVWNAFRLAILSRKQGDSTHVFLFAKGVTSESLDSEKFPIQSQMQTFVEAGGIIMACTTCLKLHQTEGSDLCPLSTIQDLYELIRDSDKVVSF